MMWLASAVELGSSCPLASGCSGCARVQWQLDAGSDHLGVGCSFAYKCTWVWILIGARGSPKIGQSGWCSRGSL